MADSRVILERSDPAPDRTIRYDDRETGVVEVWAAGGRAATGVKVVLVHGGFWQPEYDRRHLRPLAAALAGEGHAVASLEYARARMPGGGWPGTGADVLAGIAAVLSDGSLPDRLVLVGHSAGGHLALWAGSSQRLDGLVGVVSLAGVVDLALANRLDLGGGAAADLMGSADTAVWAEADPARQRLTTPAILVHGDRDTSVPLEVSQSYLASRRDDDAPCRLDVLPGVDHLGVVDPDHSAYRALVAAVADLCAS